jgi:hypothetical protein
MDPMVERLRAADGRREGIVATEPGRRRTFAGRLDPRWILGCLPSGADASFSDAPTPGYR